ncbi:MAG: hypothetical protein K2N09_02275 [Muribaculaceae bacterium]|nr:hypothetical protein [Muribaculaceae bacterium]
MALPQDSAAATTSMPDIITVEVAPDTIPASIHNTSPATAYKTDAAAPIVSTRMRDADIRYMTGSHPFSAEARKVLGGNLDISDSLSRHRILSYCEHLRTSYTTRDIDFLRQVFSDDALIIVGHTVRTADTPSLKGTPKVSYSIRSKKEYLANLAKIFDSGKDIDVRFSGFRIMRHPTMEGIYGVTLRQEYSCGGYSDDGWLFLLWDFRDPSMPLIHVRTWQPIRSLAGEDDIIDISDFNLE